MNNYSVMGPTPGDGCEVSGESFLEAFIYYTAMTSNIPVLTVKYDLERQIFNGDIKVTKYNGGKLVTFGDYEVKELS